MAIEWGFLILLAVGAAVADLRPAHIVLVMAIGWILVVLVELLAWRARPRYVVTEVVADGSPAPPPAVAAQPEPALPPPPPVTLPPVLEAEPAAAPAYEFQFQPPAEEQTAVAPAPEQAAPAGDHPYAPAPEQERLSKGDQRQIYSLEPLKARPTRKYRWFGPFLPREGETADKEG
jgi:hypothetical protein